MCARAEQDNYDFVVKEMNRDGNLMSVNALLLRNSACTVSTRKPPYLAGAEERQKHFMTDFYA